MLRNESRQFLSTRLESQDLNPPYPRKFDMIIDIAFPSASAADSVQSSVSSCSPARKQGFELTGEVDSVGRVDGAALGVDGLCLVSGEELCTGPKVLLKGRAESQSVDADKRSHERKDRALESIAETGMLDLSGSPTKA
jgi:hypothetical protein